MPHHQTTFDGTDTPVVNTTSTLSATAANGVRTIAIASLYFELVPADATSCAIRINMNVFLLPTITE